MATVKDVQFGNGRITYFPKVDPKPETKETTGNVTIVNSAIEGIAAHYEVSFLLDSTFEHDGFNISNVFHWSCLVSEQSDRAQYRLVEDQAARQIVPMLRSLADKIEASLPTFDGNLESGRSR